MDFPKGEILSPIRLYEASVSNGFRDDPSQREVLSHLTILQQTLNSRISNNINLKDRIFSWVGLRGSEPNLKGLRGRQLYFCRTSITLRVIIKVFGKVLKRVYIFHRNQGSFYEVLRNIELHSIINKSRFARQYICVKQ